MTEVEYGEIFNGDLLKVSHTEGIRFGVVVHVGRWRTDKCADEGNPNSVWAIWESSEESAKKCHEALMKDKKGMKPRTIGGRLSYVGGLDDTGKPRKFEIIEGGRRTSLVIRDIIRLHKKGKKRIANVAK